MASPGGDVSPAKARRRRHVIPQEEPPITPDVAPVPIYTHPVCHHRDRAHIDVIHTNQTIL
jgi:hypothetical protein